MTLVGRKQDRQVFYTDGASVGHLQGPPPRFIPLTSNTMPHYVVVVAVVSSFPHTRAAECVRVCVCVVLYVFVCECVLSVCAHVLVCMSICVSVLSA